MKVKDMFEKLKDVEGVIEVTSLRLEGYRMPCVR
jgi:hypothetical protein